MNVQKSKKKEEGRAREGEIGEERIRAGERGARRVGSV